MNESLTATTAGASLLRRRNETRVSDLFHVLHFIYAREKIVVSLVRDGGNIIDQICHYQRAIKTVHGAHSSRLMRPRIIAPENSLEPPRGESPWVNWVARGLFSRARVVMTIIIGGLSLSDRGETMMRELWTWLADFVGSHVECTRRSLPALVARYLIQSLSATKCQWLLPRNTILSASGNPKYPVVVRECDSLNLNFNCLFHKLYSTFSFFFSSYY